MLLSCETTSIFSPLPARALSPSVNLLYTTYKYWNTLLLTFPPSRWVAQANKLEQDWQPPTNHNSHLAPVESMSSLIGAAGVTSGCKIALIGRINMTTRITRCLIGCRMWRGSRGVGPGREEAQYPSRSPQQLPERATSLRIFMDFYECLIAPRLWHQTFPARIYPQTPFSTFFQTHLNTISFHLKVSSTLFPKLARGALVTLLKKPRGDLFFRGERRNEECDGIGLPSPPPGPGQVGSMAAVLPCITCRAADISMHHK